MQWADYSSGRPSGAALKAAGFGGVICYVGLGSSGKRITAAEYRDLVANGLQVLLVAEQYTTDAWGGYQAGTANATAALNDARSLGIPDSVPIFAAADSHATSSQISAAVDYARGFRDVLGHARAGFYGFQEVLTAVHNAGHVSFYWRCGPQPTAAEQTWIHLWQRNTAPTIRTVDGIQCDIDEQYLPITEDNMPTAAEVVDELMSRQVGLLGPNGEANAHFLPFSEVLAYVDFNASGAYNKVDALVAQAGTPVTIDLDALAAKVAPLVQAGVADAIVAALKAHPLAPQ